VHLAADGISRSWASRSDAMCGTWTAVG